jgi:ribosomal protein S18 acetylase RimI-like enzyme
MDTGTDVRLEDWRDLADGQAAALYGAERRRWLRDLSWDLTDSWRIVEDARRAGLLPGWVARHVSGRVEGWCYFLVRDGRLQLGALSGQRASTVRGLLDAVLATPEASVARQYDGFLYPESDAVVTALVRRRFRLEPYHYLERALDTRHPGATTCRAEPRLRPWAAGDLPDAVRLVARAYAGSVGMRCFAPGGRLDEWTTYLSQMVRTGACGRLAGDCSFVATGPLAVEGLALTTWVGPDTAHIAQVAVDPACRGRGLGRFLMSACLDAAQQHGARRVTLLVAGSNVVARGLYAGLGFTERARFVFGERSAMTRAGREPVVGRPARLSA